MGTLTASEIATAHRRHPIATEEDVGALRRAVRALASRVPGLREGEPELVATELATNLLRHATPGGYVLVRPLADGLELIAVDRGPGLSAAALDSLAADTHVTLPPFGRIGLGVGLGSVRRRARVFDYYSTSSGTVILARLQAQTASRAARRWLWGGVNVPLGGDGPSGDGWAVAADEGLAALMVDGLGHGDEAAAAAHAALTVFDRWHSPGSPHQGPAEAGLGNLTREAHQAMRATRGGVLGACLIEPHTARLVFNGVGNIHGCILGGPRRQHLLSQPGTLGTQLAAPRVHTTAHRWAPGSILVLASDGIDTRWDPAAHPGLTHRHPAVVAAVIHRDHARGSDDAAVLVVQDISATSVVGGER